MKGKRQGYQSKLFPAGLRQNINIDKQYRLLRLRFLRDDQLPLTAAERIELEVEGENLFSGISVPLALVTDPVDDATAAAAVQRGGNVLVFDDPPEWSIEYPIKARIATDDTNGVWISTEAVPFLEG